MYGISSLILNCSINNLDILLSTIIVLNSDVIIIILYQLDVVRVSRFVIK